MNIKGLIAAICFGFSSSAMAVSVSFDLLDPVSADGENGVYADVFHFQADGYHMQVSGYSSGGDNFDPFAEGFSQASIGLWNGIMGVEGEGAMSHTVDNFGLDYDFLILEFDEDVMLDSVGLGYIEADSDMSIAALGVDGLITSDTFYDAQLGANDVSSNPAVYASTWLIGAFHPMFGAAQDALWDGFKINEVSVTVSSVPLPAAFWFLASGLLALGYIRRKAA